MKETMRETLRRLVMDILSDGEEKDIPTIKSLLQEQANLVYKKDYTESQIAGTFSSLKTSGKIRLVQRGVYVATIPFPFNRTTENSSNGAEPFTTPPESEPHEPNSSPSTQENLLALYSEIAERLQGDYKFILTELSNYNLSSLQGYDLQIVSKIFNLRDTIKKLMECKL